MVSRRRTHFTVGLWVHIIYGSPRGLTHFGLKGVPMKYEIRELKITEILDQAIKLIQDNAKLLFGITFALLVPFALVQQFLSLMVIGAAGGIGQPGVPVGAGSPVLVLALNLLNLVFGLLIVPITNAALVHAIAKRYLQRQASVGQAFKFAGRRVGSLVITWLLLGLSIFGGIILCIVPGILCMLWFAMATQVVIIENISGVGALKRSKHLMQGNMARLFGLGLIIFAINIALTLAAVFVPQMHLRAIAMAIAQGLETILSSTTMVLFYFSARCKHENFDLTLLAESVAEEEAVVAPEADLQ